MPPDKNETCKKTGKKRCEFVSCWNDRTNGHNEEYCHDGHCSAQSEKEPPDPPYLAAMQQDKPYTLDNCIRDLTLRGGLTLTKSEARKIILRITPTDRCSICLMNTHSEAFHEVDPYRTEQPECKECGKPICTIENGKITCGTVDYKNCKTHCHGHSAANHEPPKPDCAGEKPCGRQPCVKNFGVCKHFPEEKASSAFCHDGCEKLPEWERASEILHVAKHMQSTDGIMFILTSLRHAESRGRVELERDIKMSAKP